MASFGHPSEAYPSRRDNYKGADEAALMLGDEIDNVSDDLTTNARRISEQYDPDARLSVREIA